MKAWFRLHRERADGVIVIKGIGAQVSPLTELSARFVYRVLSKLDQEEHKCVQRYRSWGLDIEWRTVWMNLHLWRFIRPVRDTAWLIAHGILPTADRLMRFGMSVDPECHWGQAESLIHLFVECSVARQLVSWYSSLVHRVRLRVTAPTPAQILTGYKQAEKLPPLFPCLLGIIKHRI